jgi:hypothetical protein
MGDRSEWFDTFFSMRKTLTTNGENEILNILEFVKRPVRGDPGFVLRTTPDTCIRPGIARSDDGVFPEIP